MCGTIDQRNHGAKDLWIFDDEKHQKKFDSLSTSKYHCRKTNKDSWLKWLWGP